MDPLHALLHHPRPAAPSLRLGKRLLERPFPLHIWEFPEAGEQALRRPLQNRVLSAAFEQKYRPLLLPARALLCPDRQFRPEPLGGGPADAPKRADGAVRFAIWPADRGTEFHQRLREVAAPPLGIDLGEIFCGGALRLRLQNIFVGGAEPRPDAQHVSVDGGRFLLKADGTDGPGGVVPDPGQRAD